MFQNPVILMLLLNDPAIYTKMRDAICHSIFMTLSKFWADFILCAHKHLRGVTVNSSLFMFTDFPRDVTLHQPLRSDPAHALTTAL